MHEKQIVELLKREDFHGLGRAADEVRQSLHPEGVVTFVVDRNINYTNVCVNRCRFCAFYRDRESPEAYVLTKDEIFRKIEETLALGGTQILIQGGINPDLDLGWYTDLLFSIKSRFTISIHGFSPPEIAALARRHGLSLRKIITELRDAGLDSIPGGGAEILSDRVRDIVSPLKIKSGEWLAVMEEAHLLGMRTTATMMFGSVEEPRDIAEHLLAVRDLQARTGGFTAFIPWTFQPGNTVIGAEDGFEKAGAVDYLKVLAVSRIVLRNIPNIQASWVTQGIKIAQVALRFGANDFGSTMIEENVVRAAGVNHAVSMQDMIGAIRSAGFVPARRDTRYNILQTF